MYSPTALIRQGATPASSQRTPLLVIVPEQHSAALSPPAEAQPDPPQVPHPNTQHTLPSADSTPSTPLLHVPVMVSVSVSVSVTVVVVVATPPSMQPHSTLKTLSVAVVVVLSTTPEEKTPREKKGREGVPEIKKAF